MRARWILLLAVGSSFCLAVVLAGCIRPTAAPQAEAPDVPLVRAHGPEAEPGAGESAASVFPGDSGGKLLAELLLPPDRELPRARRTAVRSRHAVPPRTLEQPDLEPLPGLPSLPRPSLGQTPAVTRPRPLLDEPVPNGPGLPVLPERPAVPAGYRVRLPSPDASRPAPLPYLAQPHPDRAPPDDPTVDASTGAALAAVPPMRTTPAPFLRLTIPDPFENRAAIRLRIPWEEDTNPPTATPRRPGP